MRIGIFLQDIPPVVGGAYTFQAETMEAMLSLQSTTRHKFFLIVPQKQFQVISDMVKDYNISIIPYNDNLLLRYIGAFARRSNLFLLDTMGVPNQLLKKNKIEFVCFLSPAPFPLEIPYLTIVWDLQHRLQPWFPELCTTQEWQNRESLFSHVILRASIIITGNATGREEIKRAYGIDENRIHLLPHPTPAFFLRKPQVMTENNILKKYSLKTKEFLFYPAQFWSHKNHVNLLQAFSLFRANNLSAINMKLVLVGFDKGNLAYIKQKASEFKISDNLFILGFVPADEIRELYSHAFALLYLSFFGPENLPPLEAACLGCPVILSDYAGAREQMGDAALYVPAADPEVIAQTIQRLFMDENLRLSLIEKGKQRAQQWTSQDFIKGIFRLLDDFARIRKCWI